jgi:hypothetical protein
MAPQRQVALFVVVAAALLAITAALSPVLRSPADVSHRAHPAPTETARVVLRSEAAKALAPPVPARRQSTRSPGGPAREDVPVAARPRQRAESTRRGIERRTWAFVAALLRREAGDGSSAAARRSIRATATPRLANFVLAESPRVPLATPEPADGRIARVETLRGGGSRALTQVTVTRDRTRASVLLVELIRSEGRWRAAALR